VSYIETDIATVVFYEFPNNERFDFNYKTGPIRNKDPNYVVGFLDHLDAHILPVMTLDQLIKHLKLMYADRERKFALPIIPHMYVP
jgi:hypothetical protein